MDASVITAGIVREQGGAGAVHMATRAPARARRRETVSKGHYAPCKHRGNSSLRSSKIGEPCTNG